MEFGTRSIRSAGQGSGSVEVTLPVAFRGFVGLSCRLALRDGLRPEIVLQPELRGARTAFARLWTMLAGALGAAPAADPPLADTVLTLWPVPGAAGPAPRLAWSDALALAAAPPHEAAPLARSVAAFARMLAAPLGIAPDLAAGFGAACGFALAGHVEAGAEPACDIGAALLARDGIAPGAPLSAAEDAFSAGFAAAARPALALLRDAHLDWTAEPPRHAALLAAWRRGVALELAVDRPGA
jgi:hypothetical protein